MEVERYERIWIVLSLAVLVVFLGAISTSVLAAGIQLPGDEGHVHPGAIAQVSTFGQPGMREVAPKRFDVYLVAQNWSFTPAEIRVPAGSVVTFYATSKDITHGLMIEDTQVNTMLLPGQITKVTARFDKPGTHLLICHEYCGLGHQQMSGKVIVE